MINAFSDYDRVVVVSRVEGARRVEMHRARPSFYVRINSLTNDIKRKLRSHPALVAIRNDGPWTRLDWRDRKTEKQVCLALESAGVATYEGSISNVRRVLADAGMQPMRPVRAWLDIETDSRAGIVSATEGEARVLCVSIVDDAGNAKTFLLRGDSDSAERELFVALFAELEAYDQIVSWNGDRFDFLVLENRAKRLGVLVDVRLWLWLDHLELFRRYNAMAAASGSEKQSFSLSAIANAVLGEGKDPLDASRTWEAWQADPCAAADCAACRACLVKYCERDADLMRRIEQSTGYVEILQTLCETTGALANSRGINPGNQVENYLLRIARSAGERFRTRFVEDATPEQYAGAFVMQPRSTGIVGGVHVADFASLYPSIIMSWNISPETKDPSGDALSPLTGVRFRTDVQGILPRAVSQLVELRLDWKRRKATAAPGSPEYIEADRRSTAYKIAANSFYGVIGSPMSRFFDRDLGESVAQCGVWLIKRTIEYAQLMGLEVLYSDTDSILVRGCDEKQFAEFVALCNASLYPRWLEDVGCRENRIELTFEKTFDRLLFVSAKRYCGVWKGALEIKGLEYKRGDVSRFARELQREVVEGLMGFGCDPIDDPALVDSIVERWRSRVLDEPVGLEEIKITKKLAKPIAKYAQRVKKDGSLSRRPPHVEVAAELISRGIELAEGARVEYVCVDGYASPKRYLAAIDFVGEFDRLSMWNHNVWPPTERLLASAFPSVDWRRFRVKRQRAAR